MDEGVRGSSKTWWVRVGLTLSLALPSFMIVEKYFGAFGTVVYFLIVAVAVWGVVQIEGSVAKLTSKITDRRVFALAVLTLGVLVAGFFAV